MYNEVIPIEFRTHLTNEPINFKVGDRVHIKGSNIRYQIATFHKDPFDWRGGFTKEPTEYATLFGYGEYSQNYSHIKDLILADKSPCRFDVGDSVYPGDDITVMEIIDENNFIARVWCEEELSYYYENMSSHNSLTAEEYYSQYYPNTNESRYY